MTREQIFFRVLPGFRLRYLKKLGLKRELVLQKLGEEIFSTTFRYPQIQSIRASLDFLGYVSLYSNHF